MSIALYQPRGFSLPSYRPLAPSREMLKLPIIPYTEHYKSILARLDAQKVWDDLYQLTNGVEPVLLCWEKLRTPGEWCHRRMVAEWFCEKLGATVDELRG